MAVPDIPLADRMVREVREKDVAPCGTIFQWYHGYAVIHLLLCDGAQITPTLLAHLTGLGCIFLEGGGRGAAGALTSLVQLGRGKSRSSSWRWPLVTAIASWIPSRCGMRSRHMGLRACGCRRGPWLPASLPLALAPVFSAAEMMAKGKGGEGGCHRHRSHAMPRGTLLLGLGGISGSLVCTACTGAHSAVSGGR